MYAAILISGKVMFYVAVGSTNPMQCDVMKHQLETDMIMDLALRSETSRRMGKAEDVNLDWEVDCLIREPVIGLPPPSKTQFATS